MRWLGPPKTRASARRSRWPPFLTALLGESISPGTGTSSCSPRRAEPGCGAQRSSAASSAPRSTAARRSGPRRAARRSRPGLTFHGLRHSHKTWLIAGGAPENAQAWRLGHLDNRVIETYSHVAPEVERRLLEDLERRWHTAAPPPPTPSPSVVDGGRVAPVVPLFATVWVTRQTSPGTGGMPCRRCAGTGAVLQFCPTRSMRSRHELITEDRTRNAENPSDQPEELKRRGSLRSGAKGTRTPDPLTASEVRYQLRHSPEAKVYSASRMAIPYTPSWGPRRGGASMVTNSGATL